MKKRVLSALLALCLTLSLAGAAFAENETSGDSSSAASQAVSSVESEPQTQDEMVSSGSVSGEDQTAAKTESTPAASDVAEEEPESTPEPEAATEPDTTPAPTEDPVADVTENEESDGSVEYTAALEADGETMNVIVTAPEGAFAEGVQPKLSVTMLTAEDELNAVADKLDTAEVQYDGFAALDITFTDEATGEEVEPVKSVTVRIELPQAIVDSGIDLSTLAVQHLEEDENGNVQNVTEVATLDNGITLSEEAAAAVNEAAGVAPMSDMPAEEAAAGDATETPAAVAEFEVNGFSRFTITWEGTGLNQDGTIEVTYWNTEGNGSDLAVSDQYLFHIVKLNNGDSITLQNGKLTVNNREYEIPQQVTVGNDTYEYIGAKCHYDKKWQDFTTIKAFENQIFGWNYKVDGHGSSSKPDIRLLYRKVDSSTTDPGGTTTTNTTVTTGKSAVKINGTDNYTLNLSVSGDRGSSTQKTAVDVLFIIDRSSSMWSRYTDKDSEDGYYKSRMSVLQGAVSGLVDEISSNSASIDARYAVVQFGTVATSGWTKYDFTRVLEGWTSDSSSIKRTVNNISVDLTYERGSQFNYSGVGTNYQAGIRLAKGVLAGTANGANGSARSNAATYVIFISDGVPTYSYDSLTGSSETSNDYTGNAMNYQDYMYAMQEIDSMTCDNFYAIGVSSDFKKEVLEGLCGVENNYNTVDGKVYGVKATVAQTYSATQTSDLETAFGQIAASVTYFEANNVTMIDPLSEYADLVPVSAGPNTGKYEITLALEKRANANSDYLPVSSGNATKTVYVDPSDTNGESVTLSDDTEEVPLTVFVDREVVGNQGSGSDWKETIRVKFDNTRDGNLYELAQNYRYTVSTVITPSQRAITQGKDQYNGEGEANTGTHAGADGFWSNDNDNALVTYNAITTDENGNVTGSTSGTPVNFPKPVIQVPEIKTGDLTITKTVVGLDRDALDTLENQLTFTITPPTGEAITHSSIKLSDFAEDEETSDITTKTFVYTYTFEDVPTGSYTIAESNYELQKYDCTTDPDNHTVSVTVEGNQEGTAEFTNNYTRQTGTLVLDKVIEGIDTAHQVEVHDLSFAFTITGPKDAAGVVVVNDPDPEKVVKFELDGNKAKANVQVAVGSNITIGNLPTGTYTVTETVPSETVTTSHYEIVNGKYYFASATGNGNVVAEVEKDTSKTAKIVNTYKPYKSLTLTKNIQGTGAVDTEQFTFSITSADLEHMTLTDKNGDPVTLNENTFSMRGGDSVTINKLKATDAFIISETDSKGYSVAIDLTKVAGYNSDAEDETKKHAGFVLSGNTVNVDVDGVTEVGADNSLGEIIYINKKDIPTPTGLEDNHTKPFGLMVGVAVMAGLALAGGAVVRRRRRWME